MNFMLSVHGYGQIACEIASDLRRVNAKIFSLGRCLCHLSQYAPRDVFVKRALDQVDVLIYHPARYSAEESSHPCWEIHKAIIDANPEKRFYVFASYNPEIQKFLGQADNLRYFRDTQGNVRELWNEIVELAKK